MTVKKSHILLLAFLAAAVASCQKEPSLSSLHEDYLVYTAYDSRVDFAASTTYYIPDSILLIGNSAKADYWKDQNALEIVNTVVANMDARNFDRVVEKQDADLGLQLSYVERVTYYVGYDNPYWWWYYPYYWSPGYWGDWIGWHYPFPVYYGYTAGSLLIEMVDLEAEAEPGRKLPVVWNSFVGGLLTGSQAVNLQRTVDAVNQAFAQSPYLEK